MQESSEQIIHGMKCLYSRHKKRFEIIMSTGTHQRFNGKSRTEVELQFWNYLHCRTRMMGEASASEKSVKDLLTILDMPARPIRISSGHIRRMPYRRESWIVRRSIGESGKVYFGTYHNEASAMAASRRLCELINEEVERRIIVRKG